MKKAKKLLVALLVLTFLLSTLNVGFAADEELPSEVVRAQALGILKGDEQGNLNLDKPITRAEALALIMRISGLESSANLMTGQTQFPDVNADAGLQWATGYINLGVGQEIINGYPDGTFKGRNEVTYAEMAKMLLYAMNYGKTVEGAPWPAGVMGKADDLDLFDDVNALPNVPALRGDVVKMIDNSLTVSHLKQTGYGDLAFYEEDPDTTFLSKMKVDEVKGAVVTEIAKVNSKLDDDEIKLDNDVYTLAADVSAEEIFGLKVDAWVNKDDEIFFVKVKTAADDILFDTVKAVDEDEVELKVEKKKYDWAEDAVVYVNFEEEKDLDEVPVNAYGKFVVEKGEIVFANVFAFDLVNAGVVVEVDEDEIVYNIGIKKERSLDLEDYDDGIFVYDAEFKAIDVESIEADDVIYAWDDDDELYLVVVGEIVEGELDRARSDEARIDGKNYKIAAGATVSDNEDDDIAYYVVDNDKNKDITDTTENLVGEAVFAILDINGELRHIRGDAEATSGTLYGIATDAYRNGSKFIVDIFNQEGDNVAYECEERKDWSSFGEYFGGEFNSYVPVAYELNKDGEIAEGTLKAVVEESDFDKAFKDILADNVVKADSIAAFDKNNDYIKVGKNYFYIDDTVMMKYDGKEKEGLVDWEVIKDSTPGSETKAYIVGVPNKDADFVVFFAGYDEIEDEKLYGIVTEKPIYDGDDWVVVVDVSGEGEVEYIVARGDRNKVPEAAVIAFTVNSSNEITVAGGVYDAEVKEVTGRYITFKDGGGTFRMNDDTVVYSQNDKGGIDKKLDYDDIDENDKVKYVADENNIIKAILIKYVDSDSDDDDDADPSLTDINNAENAVAMRKALLALDNEDFNSFGYSDQLNIAKKVLDARGESGFEKLEDVEEALIQAIEDFYIEEKE